MFRLHEQTRTMLCRLSFLLLGLVPTCGTIAWAVLWNRPSYQKQLASELGQRLGLLVECQHASHPLPNCTRYQGLVFRDPETKYELARTDVLTISSDDKGINIESSTPLHCKWQGWERIWSLFQQRLCSGQNNDRRLRFSFPEIHVQGLLAEQHDLTLYNFSAIDGLTGQGRDVVAGFRLKPNDAQQATVHLKRIISLDAYTHKNTTSRTIIGIDTGTSPLPCVLVGGPKSLTMLGDSASFNGTALLNDVEQGSYIELRGVISGIDLNRVIGQPFSQRLTGLAQVECAPLVISDGRISSFNGRLNARHGEIGRALAESMARTWGLRQLIPLNPQAMVLQYDEFACQFKCHDGILELRGDCESQAGVMLTAHNQRVWGEPAGPIGSPTALLQAFATDGVAQVPALPSVGYLLQWLPPASAVSHRQPPRLAERGATHPR